MNSNIIIILKDLIIILYIIYNFPFENIDSCIARYNKLINDNSLPLAVKTGKSNIF